MHGGAWNIPNDAIAACRAGCQRALEAGWKILGKGGKALDAVEAAVVVLEDDPIFDAGTGSHLNRDGRVQLDAIVMDGRTLRAGAVAAVERIRNPIRLARRVMTACEHMMLVGEGAEEFAVEEGMELCALEELVVPRERELWQRTHSNRNLNRSSRPGDSCQSDDDVPFTPAPPNSDVSTGTVGAVAMDSQGDLVAGTSTGGTFDKRPGRVGDSPLIGCGCYADLEGGGVSCTGWGEAIMKVVLAKTAVDKLRDGFSGPGRSAALDKEFSQKVARESVRLLAERTQGTGGVILLDRHGWPGFAFNTPRMAFGYVAADGSFVVSV